MCLASPVQHASGERSQHAGQGPLAREAPPGLGFPLKNESPGKTVRVTTSGSWHFISVVERADHCPRALPESQLGGALPEAGAPLLRSLGAAKPTMHRQQGDAPT